MFDNVMQPAHGQARARQVMQSKFIMKALGDNRKARRIRVVNRYFSKKGYRNGIRVKP